VAVGADADLVVWHPDAPGTISAKTHHMNIDYNAFEGWKTVGKPEVVTVRGEVAFRDGKFTGKIGRGKFLAREATHGG
jgi:dihydropyrimidinase